MLSRNQYIGIACCFLMLMLVYLFQQYNYFGFILTLLGVDDSAVHPNWYFIVNKTLRLLVNDSICLLLIYLIFKNASYVRVGLWLQLIELLVILPIYFWLKLSLEGDSEISSPMLSQLHRLIINPTLMLLLIVAFIYQRISQQPPQ